MVREWCELLPTLDHVTELRLLSKVPQDLFDAACQMPKLQDLYVKWSSVRNIEVLSNAKALRFLRIGSSTALTSIEPLRSLPRLRWLGLENLNRVADLDAISVLKQLEGLSLEGSMGSTWKVDTLSPLAPLTKLRFISLANLRAKDRTLSPLFGLRRLENLGVGAWWKRSELAALHQRNRALRLQVGA